MQNIKTKPWTWRWLSQHLASFLLLLVVIVVATATLTALIISVEEALVLLVAHRPINTYANAYGNAFQTVLWHFLLVFTVVAYWALLDTFTPEPKNTEI